MLRRLTLRDFVIVTALEIEFSDGFSALTGETGAGKSILVDALQLALGSRGDSGVVREGCSRAEITAEFDAPPPLRAWLDEMGFETGDSLLLRRTLDTQGKSRAWVNGSVATAGQLRDVADRLVDIHGQHAWQSLTHGPAVRALLDSYAGTDADALAKAWSAWKAAADALQQALAQQADLERDRERLSWQIGEIDRLAPGADEWAELNAEHQKLSNAQSLIDSARTALDAIDEADDNAQALIRRAIGALRDVGRFDGQLAAMTEVLESAQTQLQDAAHTLSSYLSRTELEPDRLQALDERLSAWMSLARRYRRPPGELPELLAQWKHDLAALDAAADLAALQARAIEAKGLLDAEAARASEVRRRGAPRLSAAVTAAMQQLGMAGGRFEVALISQAAMQSFGLESAEFMVAGHAGSTPRPLGKVASGGELSRLALAIAVTTSELGTAGTLIFDEVDAGVGGAVAESVGRLMKQLGRHRQVLAVTHLPQVAACADHHFVVTKASRAMGGSESDPVDNSVGGGVSSTVEAVVGETRVAEIARMLGGERLSSTSLAHAKEMLTSATHALTDHAAAAANTSNPADAPGAANTMKATRATGKRA